MVVCPDQQSWKHAEIRINWSSDVKIFTWAVGSRHFICHRKANLGVEELELRSGFLVAVHHAMASVNHFHVLCSTVTAYLSILLVPLPLSSVMKIGEKQFCLTSTKTFAYVINSAKLNMLSCRYITRYSGQWRCSPLKKLIRLEAKHHWRSDSGKLDLAAVHIFTCLHEQTKTWTRCSAGIWQFILLKVLKNGHCFIGIRCCDLWRQGRQQKHAIYCVRIRLKMDERNSLDWPNQNCLAKVSRHRRRLLLKQERDHSCYWNRGNHYYNSSRPWNRGDVLQWTDSHINCGHPLKCRYKRHQIPRSPWMSLHWNMLIYGPMARRGLCEWFIKQEPGSCSIRNVPSRTVWGGTIISSASYKREEVRYNGYNHVPRSETKVYR